MSDRETIASRILRPMRQTSGSILCPSCGQLVGVNDAQCYHCGRRNPGLWGFAPMLRAIGLEAGFATLILWACGALYIASLAMDIEGIGKNGLLSMISPSGRSLYVLGSSGVIPVFGQGRWWTVLSAAWLHGSLLHIVFNMMSVRNLVPAMSELYGPARTVILYTIASITGFAASSVAGLVPFLPDVLRGARYTVGASAPLFGMIGALAYYGRRSGSRMISEQARSMVMGGIVLGFMMRGIIDNWAHLGGFVGGYLASRFLDPLLPERGDHVLIAVGCLLLSAASIAISVILGLPDVR
jgi:rhomboid protease GluP